jgi:hypothetical protein
VLDILETDLIMKPFKKTVQSSPGVTLTAASHIPLQNILKQVKPKGGKLLSKKDQPEIFIILTEDIPAEYSDENLEIGFNARYIMDILERIEDMPGQRPADFGLDSSAKVKDEIARAWADAQDYWRIFQRKLETLKLDSPATTETRQQWIVPLLGLPHAAGSVREHLESPTRLHAATGTSGAITARRWAGVSTATARATDLG